MPDQPNIVYIHSHDTGRYVQPYGYPVDTPYLQAFAEQGALFRKAFCAAPTCSPSRAALLSGQSPHNAGMLGLAHRGFSRMDFSQHIRQVLADRGYDTCLSGMQHVADWRKDTPPWQQIGYDRDLGEWTEGRCREWILGEHENPFFLAVGFFETHRVFRNLDHRPDPRYVRPPAPLPDTPENRDDWADFASDVHALDRMMGEIIETIDQAGLGEDTLIIVTTDHGIAFPRMKCNLTDEGIGVMLMMRGPGGFAGGKVVESMVSHVDVFPTICELAGIETPAWVQGTSLRPLVTGETDRINDEIFSEVTFHAAYEPKRCVRTERFKYIRRFDDFQRPTLANCDGSPSKDTWLSAGWRNRRADVRHEALYDLTFDPNEHHNLAGRDDHAEPLAAMRARLDHWMRRTDDPLLDGPVQAPAGAEVNTADQAEPHEPTRRS